MTYPLSPVAQNEKFLSPPFAFETGHRRRQPQYFDVPVALSAAGESNRGRRDLRNAANGGGGGGGGGGGRSSVVSSLRGLGRTAGKRMRVRVSFDSVFMLHDIRHILCRPPADVLFWAL